MKKSTNNGLYICLEGLKGAGKTTVFNLLVEKLETENADFTTVAPTKKSDNNNYFEKKLSENASLRNNRLFRIFLYAQRSNYAADNAQWDKELVLGERSIMTSYATKWTSSKLKCWWNILVIDLLENKIKAPDYVIYIDVPHSVLRTRIETRDKERDLDDTPERLLQMEAAYLYLQQKKLNPRIANTKWIAISGDQPLENVLNDVYETVKSLLEKNN